MSSFKSCGSNAYFHAICTAAITLTFVFSVVGALHNIHEVGATFMSPLASGKTFLGKGAERLNGRFKRPV